MLHNRDESGKPREQRALPVLDLCGGVAAVHAVTERTMGPGRCLPTGGAVHMVGQEYQVAMLDELDPAGMRQIDVAGEAILLVRQGAAVFAVSAICPHAGAKLAEGVLQGDRVICPWHKAEFCIRDGAMLAPPAVDDLVHFAVRVDAGAVFVRVPGVPKAWAAQAVDDRHFVIVGGGAAGAMAAQTLRQAGFGGRVTMLDRENRVPYDRTVLSKYALSGEPGAEKSPLQSQAFYVEHAIERRTGEVVRVDAAARTITCADGWVLNYDAALLATGAAPRIPALPGADLRNVFVLRTRADAEAILAQAERSTRAVVLGASFIGMEVAASLRERGLLVTVIGREAVPFEPQLGAQVGGAFVALHKARGVRFCLGVEVTALEGVGAVRGIVLADGARVAADLVVAGFGVTPVTRYAEGVTLAEDGGIVVDAQLRAAAGLYAAGDVARFPLLGSGKSIRMEHWRVAEQQGQVAALNMLGQARPFDAVPVFWTIQYMKRLDYVGHAAAWDEVVVEGDLEKPAFLAFYVKDGVVRAVAGMDRDREMAKLVAVWGEKPIWKLKDIKEAVLF